MQPSSRSFWLDEALADDEANEVAPAPALEGETRADI